MAQVGGGGPKNIEFGSLSWVDKLGMKLGAHKICLVHDAEASTTTVKVETVFDRIFCRGEERKDMTPAVAEAILKKIDSLQGDEEIPLKNEIEQLAIKTLVAKAPAKLQNIKEGRSEKITKQQEELLGKLEQKAFVRAIVTHIRSENTRPDGGTMPAGEVLAQLKLYGANTDGEFKHEDFEKKFPPKLEKYLTKDKAVFSANTEREGVMIAGLREEIKVIANKCIEEWSASRPATSGDEDRKIFENIFGPKSYISMTINDNLLLESQPHNDTLISRPQSPIIRDFNEAPQEVKDKILTNLVRVVSRASNEQKDVAEKNLKALFPHLEVEAQATILMNLGRATDKSTIEKIQLDLFKNVNPKIQVAILKCLAPIADNKEREGEAVDEKQKLAEGFKKLLIETNQSDEELKATFTAVLSNLKQNPILSKIIEHIEDSDRSMGPGQILSELEKYGVSLDGTFNKEEFAKTLAKKLSENKTLFGGKEGDVIPGLQEEIKSLLDRCENQEKGFDLSRAVDEIFKPENYISIDINRYLNDGIDITGKFGTLRETPDVQAKILTNLAKFELQYDVSGEAKNEASPNFEELFLNVTPDVQAQVLTDFVKVISQSDATATEKRVAEGNLKVLFPKVSSDVQAKILTNFGNEYDVQHKKQLKIKQTEGEKYKSENEDKIKGMQLELFKNVEQKGQVEILKNVISIEDNKDTEYSTAAFRNRQSAANFRKLIMSESKTDDNLKETLCTVIDEIAEKIRDQIKPNSQIIEKKSKSGAITNVNQKGAFYRTSNDQGEVQDLNIVDVERGLLCHIDQAGHGFRKNAEIYNKIFTNFMENVKIKFDETKDNLTSIDQCEKFLKDELESLRRDMNEDTTEIYDADSYQVKKIKEAYDLPALSMGLIAEIKGKKILFVAQFQDTQILIKRKDGTIYEPARSNSKNIKSGAFSISHFELEEGDIIIGLSDGLMESLTKAERDDVIRNNQNPKDLSSEFFEEIVEKTKYLVREGKLEERFETSNGAAQSTNFLSYRDDFLVSHTELGKESLLSKIMAMA